MESTCLEFEFIQNREIVAAACAEVRSLGLSIFCSGCDHIEAAVVALLVSELRKAAWPLCESCARKVSELGVMI